MGRTPIILVVIITISLGSSRDATSNQWTGDQPASPSTGTALPVRPGPSRYVSTSGSDRNPGTLSRPWRTIQKALRTIQPGERALVRGGTYTEILKMSRRGTAAAPIVLQAYPGDRPVIAGRLKITGGFFRVSGFVFVGSHQSRGSALIYVSGAQNVTIFRNEIRDSRMSGVYLGDTYNPSHNIELIGNYIHSNGIHHNLDHGIYYDNGRGGLIANNLIVGNKARGIQLYEDADDVIVTHNTVVRNMTGIVVGGDGSSTADRNIVVNNIFAFNSRLGISTYWDEAVGSDNVARRNIVFGNGRRDIWVTGGLVVAGTTVADPRFANRSGGDYHLDRSSPAVNRALNEHPQTVDYDGDRRPIGRAADIGMDEYRPR
jgi:parallel beta-helix repeat protein